MQLYLQRRNIAFRNWKPGNNCCTILAVLLLLLLLLCCCYTYCCYCYCYCCWLLAVYTTVH